MPTSKRSAIFEFTGVVNRCSWMVRVGLRTTEVTWKITFPKLRSSLISPLLDALNTKEGKTRVRRNSRPSKSKMRSLQLTSICSGVHESRFTDFTLDIWTPKFRCIPAQRIQRKTPRFHDAHRGPVVGETSKISHQEVRFFRQKEQNLWRKTNEDHSMLPFAPQSEQYLFSSSFSNSDKIAWFEFCFCPLSFCVLEDIIKGNGRRKTLQSSKRPHRPRWPTKMPCVNRFWAREHVTKRWRGPYVITFLTSSSHRCSKQWWMLLFSSNIRYITRCGSRENQKYVARQN